MSRRLFPLVLMLVTGCASGPVIQTQLPMQEDVVAQQQWLLRRGENFAHLQALVQAGPGGVDVVVLDTLGQRLLTLHQKAGVATAEVARPHAVGRHWPEVLDAVLLVYWPDSVEMDLDSGVSIRRDGQERWLYREGRQVAWARCETLDPWQGHCSVTQIKSGQSLEIESHRLR